MDKFEKMLNEKNTTQISLNIPPTLKQEFETKCETENMTVSAVIRFLMVKWLRDGSE